MRQNWVVERYGHGLCAALCTLLVNAGCTDNTVPNSTASAARPIANAESKLENAKTARLACDMVSAAQMSKILGAPVTAEPISSDPVGKTDCNYAPSNGSSLPMAQLTIEYGSAEAAMTATGMLGRIEPGIASPYDGLGDQAASVGPAVWIRKGDDLITVTIMGVDQPEAAVRSVYDLVAPDVAGS